MSIRLNKPNQETKLVTFKDMKEGLIYVKGEALYMKYKEFLIGFDEYGSSPVVMPPLATEYFALAPQGTSITLHHNTDVKPR